MLQCPQIHIEISRKYHNVLQLYLVFPSAPGTDPEEVWKSFVQQCRKLITFYIQVFLVKVDYSIFCWMSIKLFIAVLITILIFSLLNCNQKRITNFLYNYSGKPFQDLVHTFRSRILSNSNFRGSLWCEFMMDNWRTVAT